MLNYDDAKEWYSLHNSGKTWRQIATMLNTTPEAVRSKVKRYKKQIKAFDIPSIVIPPSQPLTDEKPISIPGLANALILGDLHVPHHNSVMLERALKITAKEFPHIKTIVIGGDIFDFSSISSYSKDSVQEAINSSIRLGGDVMRALFAPFDLSIITPGNHDQRLAKKVDANFDFELVINAAFGKNWPKSEVKISNMDYIYMGQNWLIGHPSNYSGQGGKTPSDLADLYQRNVITFHNHVVGYSQSRSGKYIGVDAGHSTVEDQHYYKERRLNKFVRWNSGFVVLSNDYVYTFSEKFTDWKLYDL